jgi:hypothetical protein
MMSATLVQLLLFDDPTCWRADFPARTSALPAPALDSKAPAAASGSSTCASSESCGPPPSSSKTSRAGKRSGSPRSAPVSNPLATEPVPWESELPTAALRIFGPGSSSSPWPTPRAQDGQQGGSRGANAEGGASLPEAVAWPTPSTGDAENAMGYARGNGALFPTPAARDAKGRDRPDRQGGQGLESSLVEPNGTTTGIPRAERLYPTPMAGYFEKYVQGGAAGGGTNLFLELTRDQQKAQLYPTPTATAYGTNAGGQNPGPARPSIERLLLEQQRSATAGELYSTPTSSNGGEAKSMGYHNSPGWIPSTLADQVGTSPKLALNPGWVEHLMGFPPGWTDLPVELRAGGGRLGGAKISTRGRRRASSPGLLADPTGGPG